MRIFLSKIFINKPQGFEIMVNKDTHDLSKAIKASKAIGGSIKAKELVVIIDEESRKSSLSQRWFPNGKKQNDKWYNIENPLGEKKRVYGTLVTPHNLGRHAEEYLYLEITDTCNFHCSHCGVKENINGVALEQVVFPGARYMTDDFLSLFSKEVEKIKERQIGEDRTLYYGGGEPLLAPEEFKRVNSYFKNLERTKKIVLTNGCPLPLKKSAFKKFIKENDIEALFITYTPAHKLQYVVIAQNAKGLKDYIPKNVPPEEALEEKISIIGSHCVSLKIPFMANVVENAKGNGKGKPFSYDLRRYIIDKAVKSKIFETHEDGVREPCSQGYELSVRSNGDMYPHCYDIFAKTNKVGVVGLR